MHLTPIYADGGGMVQKRIVCDHCPVKIEFYVNMEGITTDIRFLWEETNKRYRIFCNIPHHACLIQYQTYKEEWQVDEVDLDFIPDWDPKTIKDKIKTYSIFL